MAPDLKFDFLCARLAELQRITKMEAEDASEEYKNFLKDVVRSNSVIFAEFNEFVCRLDTFFWVSTWTTKIIEILLAIYML